LFSCFSPKNPRPGSALLLGTVSTVHSKASPHSSRRKAPIPNHAKTQWLFSGKLVLHRSASHRSAECHNFKHTRISLQKVERPCVRRGFRNKQNILSRGISSCIALYMCVCVLVVCVCVCVCVCVRV
jgi:hypothetical protein